MLVRDGVVVGGWLGCEGKKKGKQKMIFCRAHRLGLGMMQLAC